MLKWSGIIFVLLLLAFSGLMISKALRSQKMEIINLSNNSNAGNKAAIQQLAFGSCNRQDLGQAYWEVIAQHRPQQWIWLGDNIYGDSPDLAVLREKYDKQKSAPTYQAFIQNTQVYGTWDDHDYGSNDAGKEWALKTEAATLALDFLDVPIDAKVRKRPGIYQAYEIGETGKKIKIILLDTRSFRDELLPDRGNSNQRYQRNETGDILGEAQWAWLENELVQSTASIHLIASSIQVIPEDHGYEKWANFPVARKRLLELLDNTKAPNIILLSGDRHLGEISEYTAEGSENSIYEVTSSGLTHSYESADEENRHRVGPLTGQRNYGLLTINWTNEQPDLLFQIRSVTTDSILNHLVLGSVSTASPAAIAAHFTSSIDMSKVLKPCPESPNCVSTQSAQTKKKRDPLPFSGTPAEALARLQQIISETPRTKLVEASEQYLHYEFTTWPIPFVDDVEFVVDEAAGVIHYRSASRVGYSDLGANSKRMAKIAKRWHSTD